MLPVRSITGHLFFYAFVLVVPILLVSAFIGLAYLRHEDIRVDSLAQAQVAAVSSEIGNRLDTVEATLKVLAVDPSVVFGNVDELRKRVTLIALPAGAWFVLRDPSGKQLLN